MSVVERKLDIFRVLRELDNKNSKFFDMLSADEQKAFQPLIVMRWLTGTSNKQQLFLINEIPNKYIFSLGKHKRLLYDLLSICTTGRFQKYSWIKKQSGAKTNPYSIKAIQQYFNYNVKDANAAVAILTPDNISDIAEEMGWQDDDLNKLRKEVGLPIIRKPRASSKLKPDSGLDTIEL